jgi:putative transposase
MKLIKTYKYKLNLSNNQEKICNSWINSCRHLYNLALNERIMVYEMRKKSVSKYNQYNQLPELKKLFPWFGEVYSDTIQEVLDRLDKTYQNFFRGGGFPKFSKKGEYNSFTYKRSFKVNDKTIKLPKIGEVKYFNSRAITGKPKTATIIKEDNNWFICITAEYETPFETIEVDNQNSIGLDCGGVRFLALSNNTFIDSPAFKKPFEKELRVLQRKLSRQKKGSKTREKTKSKIRKINKKISNQRLDFLHKTSTNLSDNFSSVYMEDLNLQKMQQTGFSEVNKMMSDKSFGNFKLLLSYKLKERGKHLGLVNPAYTSQTYNACGTVDKKSRISQAEFVCTSCGTVENADLNASKIILRKGITAGTKRKTLV